jgi:hypothetical protein
MDLGIFACLVGILGWAFAFVLFLNALKKTWGSNHEGSLRSYPSGSYGLSDKRIHISLKM